MVGTRVKWRELKDIIEDEFGLNPIALIEKPDAGCNTLIEKFERYARTCSYAIAVFTPDDEITSASVLELQARPNVIYELGSVLRKVGQVASHASSERGHYIVFDFGGIVQNALCKTFLRKLAKFART